MPYPLGHDTCWVWRGSGSVTESSDSDTLRPERMLGLHTGLSKDAPWEARTPDLDVNSLTL